MQKSLTCFDKIFYESTSTEEDTDGVSANFYSQNPRSYQSKIHHRSNCNRAHKKLLKTKLPVDRSTGIHHNLSVLEQKNSPNKNEITLAKPKYSSGESPSQSIIRSKWKLRDRSCTPRVVQTRRRHSDTLSVKYEDNISPQQYPKHTKSKCSVVVLCHGDKLNQLNHQLPSTKSSKNHIRAVKSENTIVTTSLPPYQPQTHDLLISQSFTKRESRESQKNLFDTHQCQTRRKSTRKNKLLNFNIIEQSQKCQACKADKNNPSVKLMAQSHSTQKKNDICEIDGEKKFPFQSTPSGNLKIIPNQVVFESKKVSVLLAEKKNNSNMEFNNIKFGEEYLNFKQTPDSELPPGVTLSTIDQLQAQQKLPQIGMSYVPRTQPHRIKHHHREMEPHQQSSNQQTTLHRLSSANEVPLSSLGFNTEEPIDWDNINLPEKTDLYQELERRITNYQNADLIVRIGHDEFYCHLIVLQSYSGFFDEKNCKEIDLTETSVTSKAFSIIYDWMISTTSESCHLLRRDNILDIFTAAQYLGIKELEEQCWAFIDNDELFCEDTAFLLYLEARKIGNTAVMELMVPRIMKFFLLLVSTKDFLELSVDELCLLLRSNYISVNSEMEVLMSAVRWLMYDWDNREHDIIKVLKCVRFGLIEPWQLIDVKRNPENPEFMKLMSYEEVQKMVDDGLAFVIIKYWHGDQTENYNHWIDLLGLTEPTNRNWAGETKNYVTYREFLLYLDEYQRTIMPELKLRRGKSMSSNQQQCPELPQSSGTHGNCINHCAIESMSLGQVGVPINNPTKISSKFLNTNVKQQQQQQQQSLLLPSQTSASAAPSHATSGASMGMGMSTEFFTKYLSSLGNNFKPDTRGNGIDNNPVKIGNAAVSYNTWQNHKLDMSEGNYYNNYSNKRVFVNNNIQCNHQLESNNFTPHEKYFYEKQSISARCGDHTNTLKSEDNTAMKIQASYRGHKTRRELNKIKQISSDENQCTNKVDELLPISTLNNKFTKRLKPTRVASISLATNKNSLKNSKRKYRSGSLYNKKYNSSLISHGININKCTNASKDSKNLQLDIEKYQQTSSQKNSSDMSIENRKSINYLTDIKGIEMNKSTTLLYNFNGQLSSATPSDNSIDIDEPHSLKIQQNKTNEYKSLYRSMINIEQHLNIDTVEKSNNYNLYRSLFHSELETVFVLGGIDPYLECDTSVNTGKDIYKYKPIENIWECVGTLPEPRHCHSTIYLCGRIYLVGGADPRKNLSQGKSFIVGTVWSYDPILKQWYSEPEMLTPRQNFGLVVTQGKIFAIGGLDKNKTALKNVEAFDPLEGKWREMQPMNTPRVGAACANFRDFIWVAGGMTESQTLKEVECYDPVNNMWHKNEPLRVARCFASLYVTYNCLYLIGGIGQLSSCDNKMESIESIDVWDTNLQTWRQLTEMSIARHRHSMACIGNQLLIIGGITTVHMKALKCIECFCCDRSIWKKGVASLPFAISGHDSVTLPPSYDFEYF